MTKPELKLLERAFEAEVADALAETPISHLLQTKSKLAFKLVESGHLRASCTVFRGVAISGYELTHLGRMEYCLTAP